MNPNIHAGAETPENTIWQPVTESKPCPCCLATDGCYQSITHVACAIIDNGQGEKQLRDGRPHYAYNLATFKWFPAPDRAAQLFRAYFLNRDDRIAVLAPWKKPCPAEPVSALDDLLKAHTAIYAPVGKLSARLLYRSKGDKPDPSVPSRIGAYTPAADGNTKWACIDLDGGGKEHASALADPLGVALTIFGSCREKSIPAYLERSFGGNGWHIWLFFAEPVAASMARRLGLSLAPDQVPLEDGSVADAENNRGIEVFPKSEKISAGGYGSLVWLPWHRLARQGCNTFYMANNRGLRPYTPSDFQTIPLSDVQRLLGEGASKTVTATATATDETGGNRPLNWKAWREQALRVLDLQAIYRDVLTGHRQGEHWLEARDPDSPSGDRDPSAGVNDTDSKCERGRWKSFCGGTYSVFDYLVQRRIVNDLPAAFRYVADMTGVPLPAASPKAADPSRPNATGQAAYDPGFITSAEFATANYPLTWLVQDVLVKGQPAIIGGPPKSLKTSIAMDLVISLGSGALFLDKFQVPCRVKVAILSGESGEAVLQETAKRICTTKKLDLAKVDVMWGFRLPQLADSADLAALQARLKAEKIEVLVIDPLYLCLLSGKAAEGINASNLYQMGPLLLAVTRACLEVGCTPILLHHARKNLGTPFQPLSLADLAFGGIQEFARQWILLNQREQFRAGSGRHELWMSVGGSAGHSGLWALTVEEGTVDLLGATRTWKVGLSDGDAFCRQRAAAKHRAKEQELNKKVFSVIERIDPDRQGVTFTDLKDALGMSSTTINPIVDRLKAVKIIEDGHGTKPGSKRKARVLKVISPYSENLFPPISETDSVPVSSESAPRSRGGPRGEPGRYLNGM